MRKFRNARKPRDRGHVYRSETGLVLVNRAGLRGPDAYRLSMEAYLANAEVGEALAALFQGVES